MEKKKREVILSMCILIAIFKEYAYLKHKTFHDQFPLNLIKLEIDKNTLQRLSHEERTDLTNFGITILDE